MNSSSTTTKLSYYCWPLGIVAFFVCLASFNLFLAIMAFSHIPDKVDSSPYEEGLNYQAVIDGLDYAKELGLTAEFSFGESNSAGLRHVGVELSLDSPSLLSSVSEIQILALRPNSSQNDTKGVLKRLDDRSKSYVGEILLPLEGMWLVQLQVKVNNKFAILKTSELL